MLGYVIPDRRDNQSLQPEITVKRARSVVKAVSFALSLSIYGIALTGFQWSAAPAVLWIFLLSVWAVLGLHQAGSLGLGGMVRAVISIAFGMLVGAIFPIHLNHGAGLALAIAFPATAGLFLVLSWTQPAAISSIGVEGGS